MKKILLLLLFTIASYGQAVFDEGIQITNTESTTATKVNVQEANGKVNTKTINTAFNKNFGLNTGDVVGATTLLNQYSTTPLDWTATAYNSGQVVFYVGKQWISKMVTVAGDVPAVSPKWEEITFEALANKTITVDSVPTDGSNNAVSSNGVFDALATKAPISSVHNPVTLGTANGLSLATQQLSLGLASSGVTGALSGTDWNTFNAKFNTPTGLTTNYLPKWNGSGFGNSIVRELPKSIGIGTTPFTWGGNGNSLRIGTFSSFSEASSGETILMFGAYEKDVNIYAYSTTGDLPSRYSLISGANVWSNAVAGTAGSTFSFVNRMVLNARGALLINKTDDDLTNQLQVAGTISAYPAVNSNQVVVKSQLDAAARPYKVYTALLTQTGTNAPTATVLENTLGGTVVWTRTGVGIYNATLSGAFTTSKTITFGTFGNVDNPSLNTLDFQQISVNSMFLITRVSGTATDSVMDVNTSIEIRIYN